MTSSSTPRLRPVIRVFVSSTFSDMRHERNALQEDVFPNLEQLCQKNGFQFQSIDLRWGVSSEAGLDHRTMRICFEELRRAQEISPKPNFLILLGDRYGWRPLPEELSEQEFEELEEMSHAESAEHAEVLRSWYLRDDNAVPPVYVLQSRRQDLHDGKNFTQDAAWGTVQDVLWGIINRAVPATDLQGRFEGPLDSIPPIVRFQASATEQEIWQGALRVPDAKEHVLAFFREIEDIGTVKDPTLIKDFVDVLPSGGLDTVLRDEQSRLKKHLREQLGAANVFEARSVKLTTDVTTEHLAKLCSDVETRMTQIIQAQIEAYWQQTKPGAAERAVRELEIEQQEHARIGQERGGPATFVGRADKLAAIHDYLLNDLTLPLVIHGASGCGKTALLARAIAESEAESLQSSIHNQKSKILFRFLGTTPRSSDLRGLLTSLCQELRLRYLREGELPTDIKLLEQELQEQFRAATREQPLTLFLDALDQLADTDGGRLLHWIPTGPLPAHVKLVVSCLSDRDDGDPAGQPYAELQRRKLLADNVINLDALSEDEARTLLFERWLPQAGRTVSGDQRTRIEQSLASPACRQPIYLKLLFEEARLLRSYDATPDLGEDVPALLDQLFDRLSLPTNHGQLLVERVLGYLAASREGLAENEILEILFRDPDYKATLDQATKDTRHEMPPNATRIPIAIWSRLRFDLASYLTERAATGANVLTFYHRQVAEWVQEHFAKASDQRWQPHPLLADYFRDLADPEINQSWKGDNPRPFRELPFHLVHAEMWSEHVSTLENISFLEAKVAHGLAFDLVGDFAGVLRKLPGNHPHHRMLSLLEEGLRRDIYFIARHAGEYPQALFQCLWNSCWWYDCPEGARHYSKGKAQGGDSAQSRSSSNALTKKTLLGRIACLFSARPQLSNAESAKDVPQLNRLGLSVLMEQWRNQRETIDPGFRWLRAQRPPVMHLGAGQRAILRGHEQYVVSVSWSPDGRRIATGSWDNTLRVWEATTGGALTIMRGHEKLVSSISWSPDSQRIVSGSWDNTLRVWEAVSGAELTVLRGHEGSVLSVSWSPDGRRIVSGAVDEMVRVWDPDSGVEQAALRRHARLVRSVSCSPDGRWIVSGSEDKSVRVWDADSGVEHAVLCGHEGRVSSVSWSPDGRKIVSGSKDKTARVWDAASGAELAIMRGHEEEVLSVSWSPDGQRIVTGSWDKTVRVWDVASGVGLVILRGHEKEVHGVSWSPDCRQIVSCSTDKTARVWDSEGGIELPVLRGHEGRVSSLSWSPDGRRIVSGSWDKTARVWDAASGVELAVLNGHEGRMTSVSWSPDSRRIASCSYDQTVRVWDAASGAELAVLLGHLGPTIIAIWSPDGRKIVTCSVDKTVRVWGAANGTELAILRGHEDVVHSVNWSPDGRQVVSGSHDNTVRVWDADNGKCLDVIRDSPDVTAITPCAPAQPFRALGFGAETVVEDAATGRRIAWFPDPLDDITIHPFGGALAGGLGSHIQILKIEQECVNRA